MRSRLSTAPAWMSATVAGVAFALAMALEHRAVDGRSWPSSVAGGVLSGLVFGAFMVPVLYRQQRRLRRATSELPDFLVVPAVRASHRGPVPADPQVRAAAARLSAQEGELLGRQQVWGVPFFVVLAAAFSWLAVTDSPWWWAGAAGFVVMAGLLLGGPARYRRRARLLQQTAD